MTTPSHSHSQSQSHSHTSSSGDTNYRHETEKEYHINHTPTRADHDDTLVDGLHDSISDKEDSVQGVKKDVSSTLPVTSVSVNGTSKGGVYSDSHGYEEKPEFFTYFAGKRIRDLPWYQVPLYPLIRAFNYFFNRDYHIHILGLMLALYFIGYQPIQALQTIRYPSLGNYNLAVLYGVFGLNSWLASFYIELLGPSLVLPLCGCFMIVFPFTLFQQAAFGTILGAASHGFGTGALWPAAGRIIASISTEKDETTNSGIYQSYYRSSALIGGLVYAVMNMPSSSFSGTSHWNEQYGIFAASEFCGICMGFLLFYSYTRSQRRKTARLNSKIHETIHVLTQEGRTEDAERLRLSIAEKKVDFVVLGRRLVQNWKTTFRVITSWEYLPLACLQFTVCGIQNAWFTANFNTALAALSLQTTGVSWLGWMQAIDQCFAIIGATSAGLILDWARRTYHINPTRIKYPIYGGIILSWIAYGLTILVSDMYLYRGVSNVGWGLYFGSLFALCFCYWVGFMLIEVSFYVFNISLFGPVSGNAFCGRVFFEGMGNMTGFLFNTQMTTPYLKKLGWPLVSYTTTFIPFMLFVFFFKPPPEYTAYDKIKKFVPQIYEYDSEALDVALREEEAKEHIKQQEAQRQYRGTTIE